MIGATIPEKPGSFEAFCEPSARQITEFNYRYTASSPAHLRWLANHPVNDRATRGLPASQNKASRYST